MHGIFYVVIATHVEHGELLFDIISSRFERTSFTEEKVKILLNMGIISGGAKLDNGKIVVAPLEKVKKPVEEVKPLEKEVPVEKEKSSEKEISVPVAKKEPEKVSKVEEKKKA